MVDSISPITPPLQWQASDASSYRQANDRIHFDTRRTVELQIGSMILRTASLQYGNLSRSGAGSSLWGQGAVADFIDIGPNARLLNRLTSVFVSLDLEAAFAPIRTPILVRAPGVGAPPVGISPYEPGLSGTGGNDRIAASGNGIVDTGAGDDHVTATSVFRLLTGSGNDVAAAAQVREIHTGDGDDILAILDSGHIDTGSGNDTVVGSAGDVWTGTGDDRIELRGGGVHAGDGNDTISVTGNLRIGGGAGNDRITAIGTHYDLKPGEYFQTGGSSPYLFAGGGLGGNFGAKNAAGEYVATGMALVHGGAGDDHITLRDATARYGRNDGFDRIEAGERSAVIFSQITRQEVDITEVKDDSGRVTQVDIMLKDGSGGVSITAGPGGARDAQVKFRDGTVLWLANVLAHTAA